MQDRDALPTIEKTITQAQIEEYAAASGDFNPIHIDKEFAAASQFVGIIAHGMLIAAPISEMMTLAFKKDWLSGGRLKIRFRAPVYPGESIITFGEVKRIRERDGVKQIDCSVGVRKGNGEVVITGDAAVAIPIVD